MSRSHTPEHLSRSETSLPRGAACLPCRRRKMRCDGGKPFCAQCISRSQTDDCEYVTPQGATRSQLLEENIAILEARIFELEHPDAPPTSVRLRAPHATGYSHSGPTIQSAHNFPAAPTSSRLKLTPEDIYKLTDAFLQNATRVGFFLNVPRFIRYVRGSGGRRLIDVLICVTCLWGSRFSNHSSVQGRSETLLSIAVQQIADTLLIVNAGAPTHDVVAFIQAEVLLANYFFTHDRLLEGKYHSSAALSLALSCKLNLQQSIQTRDGPQSSSQATPTTLLSGLPTPVDLIQICERVNAFWTVHSLYKTWSVALEPPSTVWAGEGSFGAQIEIPWPLSMDACEKGQLSASEISARGTVVNLLQGKETSPLIGLPPLSLHARAAVLFTHASWVASKYQKDMSRQDRTTFYEQFQALHSCINNFLAEVVALERIRPLRALLVISTLTRTALIRLHEQFITVDNQSRETCLAAANGTLTLLQQAGLTEFRYVDPIMAVLLVTTGQVYISEMTRYKNSIQDTPHNEDRTYIGSIMASETNLLAAMKELGMICPLMIARVYQSAPPPVA